MTRPILECQSVDKSYQDGESDIVVLHQLNLQIMPGAKCAITGPSGSGKSTLLHILGGLDVSTKGHSLIDGVSWDSLSESKRCQLRNEKLGFVYQFHHLLSEFSALENVMMPLLIQGRQIEEASQLSADVLTRMGLSHRIKHRPSQLSGGERQRVAIARAVVMKPACILADEPTGNLDMETAHEIFNLFLTLNEQSHTALVVVTHDLDLAGQMDKQFRLQAGSLL